MVPGLILRPSHIMMMQLPASHTEWVVVMWVQIKLVSPLWQKFKFESTPLERLDIFGSNFLTQTSFEFCSLRNAFFLSNSLLPMYGPLSNTRRLLGGGGGERGMLTLRVVRCILQTLKTVKGLHNYHKFYQHPAAYYTKKRFNFDPKLSQYDVIWRDWINGAS